MPWGGSEVLWSETAHQALKAGHQVSIFISRRKQLNPTLTNLKKNGAEIKFWDFLIKPERWYKRLIKKVWKPQETEKKYWQKKLNNQSDLYVISQGRMFDVLFRSGLVDSVLKQKKPFIILARCDEDISQLDYADKNEKKQLFKFFQKAKAVVAASQSTIDLLKAYSPTRIDNAFVLHSPLKNSQESLLQYPRSKLITFACVGRLHMGTKGQHILISALSSKKWVRRKFKLLFYGSGPDEEHLKHLVQKNKLKHKIVFKGFDEKLEKIWGSVHLAIQPSLLEGTPQSLLEAMLCGRPVVATSVSGIPEWVAEKKSGFLASSPRVSDLSEALEEAWKHRKRWREMGLHARSSVEKKINPDPAKTLFEKILNIKRRNKANA